MDTFTYSRLFFVLSFGYWPLFENRYSFQSVFVVNENQHSSPTAVF